MASLDLLILIVLGIFFLVGFIAGFIHTLGSIIGAFAGAYLAGKLYEPLANFLLSAFQDADEKTVRIISFIILFLFFARLIGYFFHLLDKGFKFISFIPFLESINRLAGGILGLIEGLIAIGLIIYLLNKFVTAPAYLQYVSTSRLVHLPLFVSRIILPFVPEMIKKMQSWVTL